MVVMAKSRHVVCHLPDVVTPWNQNKQRLGSVMCVMIGKLVICLHITVGNRECKVDIESF